jgi:hypothetical protein
VCIDFSSVLIRVSLVFVQLSLVTFLTIIMIIIINEEQKKTNEIPKGA